MSTFALRDLLPDDADWITAACQDAEIERWLPRVPRPYRREHAEQFIGGASGDLRTWVIEHDGGPAGVIGMHEFDLATGVAMVGYWIAPWARRRGAAQHALLLVAEQVAALPGAACMRAHIAATNLASRATAEAAGFRLVEQSATLTCPDGACQVPTMVSEAPSE